MKILGLTGAVASGKNFIADIFAKKGAVVFDADLEVHNLLNHDQAIIDAVTSHFPESISNGKIDRKILGKIVFNNSSFLQILEESIHPRLQKKCAGFIEEMRLKGAKLVVLNIPLLLEKPENRKIYQCDKVVVVITSHDLRQKRFIEREKKKFSDGKFFEEELISKFNAINGKQVDDETRKKLADFVIYNDDEHFPELQIEEIIRVCNKS
jgi:dephospho-CoA kinase